ncbi:MAG: hypothetical protein AB7R40_22460 [Nitrospiraceae bacterium]
MDSIDYTKPIMFRPSTEDTKVLELLAQKNPVFSATSADLLRVALQDYMFNHGPDQGHSKNTRLERMENELAEHRILLEAICTKLNIPVGG